MKALIWEHIYPAIYKSSKFITKEQLTKEQWYGENLYYKKIRDVIIDMLFRDSMMFKDR